MIASLNDSRQAAKFHTILNGPQLLSNSLAVSGHVKPPCCIQRSTPWHVYELPAHRPLHPAAVTVYEISGLVSRPTFSSSANCVNAERATRSRDQIAAPKRRKRGIQRNIASPLRTPIYPSTFRLIGIGKLIFAYTEPFHPRIIRWLSTNIFSAVSIRVSEEKRK